MLSRYASELHPRADRADGYVIDTGPLCAIEIEETELSIKFGAEIFDQLRGGKTNGRAFVALARYVLAIGIINPEAVGPICKKEVSQATFP